jgi:hypothetical protein
LDIPAWAGSNPRFVKEKTGIKAFWGFRGIIWRGFTAREVKGDWHIRRLDISLQRANPINNCSKQLEV